MCGFSSPSLLHLLHVASNYFWRTHAASAAAAAAASEKNRFFGSGGEEEEGLEKSVKNGREVHLLRVRRTNVVLFSPPLHIYGRWCLHARVRPKSSGRLRRRRDYHHRVLPNNKPTDSSFEVGGRGGIIILFGVSLSQTQGALKWEEETKTMKPRCHYATDPTILSRRGGRPSSLPRSLILTPNKRNNSILM